MPGKENCAKALKQQGPLRSQKAASADGFRWAWLPQGEPPPSLPCSLTPALLRTCPRLLPSLSLRGLSCQGIWRAEVLLPLHQALCRLTKSHNLWGKYIHYPRIPREVRSPAQGHTPTRGSTLVPALESGPILFSQAQTPWCPCWLLALCSSALRSLSPPGALSLLFLLISRSLVVCRQWWSFPGAQRKAFKLLPLPSLSYIQATWEPSRATLAAKWPEISEVEIAMKRSWKDRVLLEWVSLSLLRPLFTTSAIESLISPRGLSNFPRSLSYQTWGQQASRHSPTWSPPHAPPAAKSTIKEACQPHHPTQTTPLGSPQPCHSHLGCLR